MRTVVKVLAAAGVLVLAVALRAEADRVGPPPKPPVTFQFKRGQFEFKHGGKAYVVALRSGELVAKEFGTPREKRSIHFVYETVVFATMAGYPVPKTKTYASFSLADLVGPGKYRKANIATMEVQKYEMLAEAPSIASWLFDRNSSDCTFTLRRLDPTGVNGSVVCTGMLDAMTRTTQPLDAAFTASP